MRFRKVFVTGIGLAFLTTSFVGVQAQAVQAADARPNIVVMYMDDVSEDQRHLWCNPRAPELQRFCNQGVEFRNAIGSTPLCGPARANLLTGQYSHNNGVTENSLEGFNPNSTIATKLQGVGYFTAFAGKHGNGLPKVAPTRNSVYKYAKGWNKFDPIWKRTTRKYREFYKYFLWTKYRTIWKGDDPKDHSTRVVGKRLARHIRNAPDNKPIFAFASVYSGHAPNIAMARHIGSSKCKYVKPWSGPSYNEKDVSDKPIYVQKQPLLSKKSFSLRTRCEEILSVNYALKQIRQALKDTGRLNNTLIIFTSDNGFLMGDHRKPAGKRWPYAAPVHMYMLWPAKLHNQRRVVREPVSNVDIAPTLCKLAGCQMSSPDGLNILPLMKGTANRFDRQFVYVENLHPWNGMPPWYGLHTTKSYSTNAFWVYTELKTGERELYNVTKDPFQLNNLAGKPWQVDRIAKFHNMLHNQVIKPEGVRFLN